MGTDLYGYMEYKHKEEWHPVLSLGNFDLRNYEVFGALFGFSSTFGAGGNWEKPITNILSKPPTDISWRTRDYFEKNDFINEDFVCITYSQIFENTPKMISEGYGRWQIETLENGTWNKTGAACSFSTDFDKQISETLMKSKRENIRYTREHSKIEDFLNRGDWKILLEIMKTMKTLGYETRIVGCLVF